MLTVGSLEPSRYIRTTWMLSAHTILKFTDRTQIRFMEESEAAQLAAQVQKRNVFARHSRENSFYVQRARELAYHTVIEVFRPGNPQDMVDEAEIVAAGLVSSAFILKKGDFQRRLGISLNPRTESLFIVSPEFRLLSSKSRAAPIVQGILVDEKFTKRFSRCGFNSLADYIQSKTDIANRVSFSLGWLFDSRIEPQLPASITKTAIALESLLIFSESESLAQSLSERAAFILSANANERHTISRILKRFYNMRSGVVHGSQKKAKKLSASLLETVDRLTILLYLVIAANPGLWPSTDALREWCGDTALGKRVR